LQGPEAREARRTSHALVPCRSEATPVVRRLLARDLASWETDAVAIDGLLIAACEAVGNAVANGRRTEQNRMLVVSWTLAAGSFRFSVQDRGRDAQQLPTAIGAGAHPVIQEQGQAVAPAGCERRAAAMRAHPSAGVARGRCVLDALMDRVMVHDGQLGTRILIEKALR
jgi:anti-sigma regulatory factor (Ser/Thr protein kinase)